MVEDEVDEPCVIALSNSARTLVEAAEPAGGDGKVESHSGMTDHRSSIGRTGSKLVSHLGETTPSPKEVE